MAPLGAVSRGWLGEATEQMLDLAGSSAGSRVLDIAAGAGGQTIAAARRARRPCSRPTSRERILEYAADEARRAGPRERRDA